MTKLSASSAPLGTQIKLARKAQAFTQGELGSRARLHRNALVALEAGRGNIATLLAAATALGFELTGRGLSGDGPLGERLRRLRESRKLGRRAAAALAGVSVPAIENVERSTSGHVSSLESLGRAIAAGLCLVPKGTDLGFWQKTAASSSSAEWYTPDWLIQRVIAAAGPIDTDPCSPGRKKSAVPARLHLTQDDDGLKHAWPGTVWMNPPYGPAIPHWLAKARRELDLGHAQKVVALVPARTDTRWWHDHVACIADIILLKGRVTFSGAETAAPFPSALLGYRLSVEERDLLFAEFPDAWHVPLPR